MIESAMTQDILKYQAKFIGNFSAREAVCIGIGVAAGLGAFFGPLSEMPITTRIYIAAPIMVPFFLFGFLKPMGQPLEKVLGQVIYDNFICPPIRTNEIHHTAMEKYEADPEFDLAKYSSPLYTASESASEPADTEAGKADKKTKSQQKKKSGSSKEKKVARSKEYKAIR